MKRRENIEHLARHRLSTLSSPLLLSALRFLLRRLGVSYRAVLFFKVFRQQAVYLQQAFAGELHAIILHNQIACLLLIREGFAKFLQNIHAELLPKGFGGDAAFLHL